MLSVLLPYLSTPDANASVSQETLAEFWSTSALIVSGLMLNAYETGVVTMSIMTNKTLAFMNSSYAFFAIVCKEVLGASFWVLVLLRLEGLTA
jgi:hypothetical protein